jgi:hypothetical protein
MPGQLSNYLKKFNKLDDPKATQRDKTVDIAKSVVAIAGLIPNPDIGPAVNLVVEAASYLTDSQEGRHDAPPKPADINSRTNPIGDRVNKIIIYSG